MDLHSLCILYTGILMGLCGVSAPPSHHSAGGRSPWACHSMGGSPGNENCMLTLTRRSWLLFSPCLYGCLSWQIPNGKEGQTEFLLPAFNASVVTHQLLWIAVVLPLRSLLDIPVTQAVTFLYTCTNMVCSDFMADGMYVSQCFLCLLLTRKFYKTHLVTTLAIKSVLLNYSH